MVGDVKSGSQHPPACPRLRQRPPTILHILRPETHGKHPPHRPGGPKIQNSSLRVPSENSTIGKSVRAPARMRSQAILHVFRGFSLKILVFQDTTTPWSPPTCGRHFYHRPGRPEWGPLGASHTVIMG